MTRDRIGRIDKILLLAVLAVAFIGIFFVYSATWGGDDPGSGLDPRVVKQIIWVFLGVTLLFTVANMDYLRVINFAYVAYGINIALLLFLLMFGGERYGARRWISLGPVSLQPSEFVKITVILILAYFLGERREKLGTLDTYVGAFLLVAPAAVLIFMQPDLGTAFVLAPILLSILFVCGSRLKYIAVTVCGALAALPFFWMFLKDYQKNRLMVFLNPDLDPLGAGYTIIQSKIAIGSGGLFGKGWLNGTQSYLRFLPERHTDFIFSVVGEEWGFIGALFLLGLYVLIIVRGVKIISEVKDVYGKVIATGVVTLIAFQVVVNISMTIGLMPVVGLPLPAITYGGSNTLATLFAAGLLLSVSRRANR